MEPRQIGDYFKLDAKGFILNDTCLDKISAPWNLPVTELVDLISELGGDRNALFIRGSVPSGRAVPHISDIDLLFFTDAYGSSAPPNAALQPIKHVVLQRYAFIRDIELSVHPVRTIQDTTPLNFTQFLLSTQAVCLFQNDVEFKPKRFKIDHSIQFHLRSIQNDIEYAQKEIQMVTQKVRLMDLCSWICKRILRSLFEITMISENKYTRDLFLCATDATRHFPELKKEISQTLHFAIQPIADKEPILSILDKFDDALNHQLSAAN